MLCMDGSDGFADAVGINCCCCVDEDEFAVDTV